MKHFLLFLLMCSASIAFPQQANFSFKRIGADQGLSYNTVHAIFQDSRGYLWLGTEDGLNRYDGYTFTIYKADPADTSLLTDNNIDAICEDGGGDLWIGTNKGLHSYHPQEGVFRRHHLEDDGDNPNSQGITSLLLQPNGNLWIGTRGGLKCLNTKTKKVQAFYHDPKNPGSLSSNVVMNLQPDGEKGLWIGTFGGGLNYYSFEKERFTHYRHDPANPNSLSSDKVRGLAADTKGRIWVGSQRDGLNMLDPATGKWTHYRHNPLNPSSINDDRIAAVQQLPNQPELLWIGTDGGGINILNLENGAFEGFSHNPADPESISNNSVYAIFQDKGGKVWLGTELGINVLDPAPSPFRLYRNNALNPLLLSDNFVVSLCTDRKGNIWVGSKGAGLTKLNLGSGQSRHYRHDPAQPGSLGDNVIQSLYEDRSGTIWVGTAHGGLHRYDSGTDSFVSYRNQQLREEYLYHLNDIHTIFEDSKGRFWLGTHGGLFLFDRNRGTFTSYQHDPENGQSISSSVIGRIAEDKKGNLWISTFTGGINRFNPEKELFTRYQHKPGDASSLSNNGISALYLDEAGDLWIGTHRGLNRYLPETETFEVYLQKDGLPDERIYGILEDGAGRLWLSTRNGLAAFDKKEKRFRNFTVQDGLQGNSFAGQLYFGAHCKGKDGLLYFGGSGGFNSVNPANLRHNNLVPPIVLTGLSVHNKPLARKEAISALKAIDLSHEDNVISFEFAALDFTQPEKNSYAYKLEGLDREWIYSGNRRTASYTNLDPGEYVFRVKGANNDGVWNEAGTAIRISIAPPPWKTWWAYTIYFLFVFSILFTFWRYTLVQERLQHALKLERLESEKLHELDGLKSRFFANISHEFRTPLSLILSPLEELLSREENSHRQHLYQIMQRNSRRLLQLINQLLDISKIEAGNMKLHIAKVELVKSLRIMLASFASLAENRGISLHFHTELEELFVCTDPDKLEKIFYNLLSNALKFTPPGGSVEVRLLCATGVKNVQPGADKAFFEIQVQDSGIGIAADQLDLIFDRFYQADSSHTRKAEGTGIGLALTRELVHLLQGNIEVRSEIDKGSCFSVRLPLTVKGESETTAAEEPAYMGGDLLLHAQHEQEAAPGPADQKPLLLIVEDNEDLRSYMRDSFRHLYRIQLAADGVEGFEKAVAEIPDLVISDLMMPLRDGNQLCHLLKEDERTSHIPVILLTAKANLESKLEGLENGADDYLTKPFSAEELRMRVKNLISQRRKLRERYSQGGLVALKEQAVASADERFLQKALAIVEQHMSDADFSVELFGQEIGMSRMQLHRKLTALTGKSASDFIRTLRLQKAASLLRQQWGGVAEVAYETGFQSLSYFSKCFKETYGLTPTEYVSQHTAEKRQVEKI